MQNLPQIKIEINPDIDAGAFVNFLWHPFLKQNRSMITRTYPEVGAMLDSDSARDDVKKFVLTLHQHKKEQLEKIKNEQEKIILEKETGAFQRLVEIMDYTWENPFVYTAYLSLLPFSPFKDDHFLYSTLGQLNESVTKSKPVLVVAIHEISHVMFFHILKRLNIQLLEGTKHLFKEALTAAILQDEKLLTLLNYKHVEVNPEIRELYVKKDGRILKTTDYLFTSLIENVDLNKIFLEKLKELLKEFKKVDKDFDEKMNFWNRHGSTIFKDERLLQQYREPIPLD